MSKFGNSVCCLRVGILWVLWGVGIVSSQVFGHLRSFKGWIQTEACVIPSYHGMLIRNRETNRDIISVAVVPPKQQLFVQPKLKNNNVHLIRYNCSTRLWDALYECLAKEMCLYIYAFSRHFYPKRLTLHSSYSFTFDQLLLSVGIVPMILALLAPCSTIWATGKL